MNRLATNVTSNQLKFGLVTDTFCLPWYLNRQIKSNERHPATFLQSPTESFFVA